MCACACIYIESDFSSIRLILDAYSCFYLLLLLQSDSVGGPYLTVCTSCLNKKTSTVKSVLLIISGHIHAFSAGQTKNKKTSFHYN